MKSAIRTMVLIIFALTGLSVSGSAQSYQSLKSLSITPNQQTTEGEWGTFAVEPPSHRLFVSRGNTVEVFDEDSQRIGEIPNLLGIRAIAIDSTKRLGFVATRSDSTLTIFDTATLKVSNRVVLQDSPDLVVVDVSASRLFVIGEGQSTVIDTGTGEIVGKLPISDAVAADSSQHGLLFVATSLKSVLVFDTQQAKFQHEFAVDGCDPRTIAADKHSRFFVGCANGDLKVLNTESGKQVAHISVCKDVYATAYDDDKHVIVNACRKSGTVLIQQQTPDKYAVLERDKLKNETYAMAFDPATNRIFLAQKPINPVGTVQPLGIFVFGHPTTTATQINR